MKQVEKINCFVGTPLTIKQWSILLQGIGCPKNAYFWQAFQDKMIIQGIGSGKHTYTLSHSLSENEYEEVLTYYRKLNNAAVRKYYQKKQAKNLATQATARITNVSFFIVNGCITTEKPERD